VYKVYEEDVYRRRSKGQEFPSLDSRNPDSLKNLLIKISFMTADQMLRFPFHSIPFHSIFVCGLQLLDS
jgi:hypothetical protein